MSYKNAIWDFINLVYLDNRKEGNYFIHINLEDDLKYGSFLNIYSHDNYFLVNTDEFKFKISIEFSFNKDSDITITDFTLIDGGEEYRLNNFTFSEDNIKNLMSPYIRSYKLNNIININ